MDRAWAMGVDYETLIQYAAATVLMLLLPAASRSWGSDRAWLSQYTREV